MHKQFRNFPRIGNDIISMVCKPQQGSPLSTALVSLISWFPLLEPPHWPPCHYSHLSTSALPLLPYGTILPPVILVCTISPYKASAQMSPIQWGLSWPLSKTAWLLPFILSSHDSLIQYIMFLSGWPLYLASFTYDKSEFCLLCVYMTLRTLPKWWGVWLHSTPS